MREHPSNHVLAAVRRLVDIAFALLALVLTCPVLLLIAIVIKRDSPGPAVFRQRRVGYRGQLITFYKFRTHYANARELFPELFAHKYTLEELKRVRLKVEQDPRVTRVGRWLRKTTLDELPNFWNLLRGDVTLVGPRPDITEVYQYYSDAQRIKYTVKPGITGLAQTRGRGNLRFRDQIRYDMFYVKKRNVWLDLQIFFRTIKMVVKFDGAF